MKPTKKQIKANMQKWIGWYCMLIEPHPLAGNRGTAKEVREINKKLNFIIKLDNGETVNIPQGSYDRIMFLEPLSPIN